MKAYVIMLFLGCTRAITALMSKWKKLTIDDIDDIYRLRVIVEYENDCYKALEVVHQLWSAVRGKLKDYISHPKHNGYQTLQTGVIGEGKVPLVVQIRTEDMHLYAEFGFTPDWSYWEDCRQLSTLLRIRKHQEQQRQESIIKKRKKQQSDF